jgi:hypothetical protein
MRSYIILYSPVETNINVNYALKESQLIPELIQTPDFELCSDSKSPHTEIWYHNHQLPILLSGITSVVDS